MHRIVNPVSAPQFRQRLQPVGALAAALVLALAAGARAEFTLDGIVFESTPVIRTFADITNATGGVIVQSIMAADCRDIFFRADTGQFALGLFSSSTHEVALFNAPTQGADFTVNATGAAIAAGSSQSLSEGAANTVIRSVTANGDFIVETPFTAATTVEFTANACTAISRYTRGKLHASGLFFGVTGDAFISGGNDGLVAFRLTGTSPDFSGAVTGAVRTLPEYGHSAGQTPGIALTPNDHIMVSSKYTTGMGAYQIYEFSGIATGSEIGTYTLLESGSLNTLAGLVGGDQMGSASALAFGVNGKGLIVLAVVDSNNTFGVGTDDRIFFFVERSPQGTVVEIE